MTHNHDDHHEPQRPHDGADRAASQQEGDAAERGSEDRPERSTGQEHPREEEAAAEAGDGTSQQVAVGTDPQEDAALDIEALADSDPRTRAELLAELLAAEAKRDEYLDDLRRSHADFENYRRRVMRDGALQRSSGKADVAGALLEVLDDLDRTVHAAQGSPDEDLATGVRLVATKLLDALRQRGLERIDEVEVAFDPGVHEAVQQQPGDGIDGQPKVVTVLRPGYRMDDRVLRAAMVAVEN